MNYVALSEENNPMFAFKKTFENPPIDWNKELQFPLEQEHSDEKVEILEVSDINQRDYSCQVKYRSTDVTDDPQDDDYYHHTITLYPISIYDI